MKILLPFKHLIKARNKNEAVMYERGLCASVVAHKLYLWSSVISWSFQNLLTVTLLITAAMVDYHLMLTSKSWNLVLIRSFVTMKYFGEVTFRNTGSWVFFLSSKLILILVLLLVDMQKIRRNDVECTCKHGHRSLEKECILL